MKYAIDISNKEIKEPLINKLKEDGYSVIDCCNDECTCLGESFYKKVLLSNQTKVDVFLNFEIEEGDCSKVELYGDDIVLSKLISRNMENILREFNTSEICIKGGKNLYLIKNLDSLCIVMKLTSNGKNDLNKIVNILYKLLKNIDNEAIS